MLENTTYLVKKNSNFCGEKSWGTLLEGKHFFSFFLFNYKQYASGFKFDPKRRKNKTQNCTISRFIRNFVHYLMSLTKEEKCIECMFYWSKIYIT